MRRRLSRSFVAVGVASAAVVGLTGLAGAAEKDVVYPFPEKTVAPGESITLSGTGCLVDGAPGYLTSAIADVAEVPNVTVLPNSSVADEAGKWTLTNRLPSVLPADLYVIAVACTDADGVEETKLDNAIFVLHIDRPQTPGTTTEPKVVVEPPTPKAVEKAADKVEQKKVTPPKASKPKAVPAKPKFAG
jgi:hypothetical protein